MNKGLLDPESEKVRNLEMSIREAKDELIRMSNYTKQREIYEMRAKILKYKISSLNKAKEEGRKEEKVLVNLLTNTYLKPLA